MAFSGPVTAGEREAVARMRLCCWGDFALTDEQSGIDLKPRGRKTRALLAFLAFHPGKPVSRERLTGLLWGDRGDEQARASLRQAILELKPLSGDVLSIERDYLTLHANSLVTDVDAMREAVAARDYTRLLDLLPDSGERLFANLDGIDEGFDDWLAIERTRQQDALVTLIADASAAALAEGQTRHARALHARRREFDPAADTLLQSLAVTVPPVPVIAPPKPKPRKTALLAALVAALAMIVAGAWWFARSGPERPATIAVLPFKSVPTQDASFADGLSDEITAQLARQPGLRVAGRSSASQFRDAGIGVAEIGRRLRVKYVLEGSVRSEGDRIRVIVALASASDGLQLWSETFDGTLNDVLAIQYRISVSVARALNVKLARADPPTGALATSGEVYSLYLSARGLIKERNPKAIDAAHEKLLRAVKLDPNFAPAWSSLAQTENPGGVGPDLRLRTAKAIADAEKALALAPDLAEAHGVLGMLYGFDHPVGAQHVERAAALDPNNAEFQFWLGNVYACRFDFARLLEARRRAYALDPLWIYTQESVVSAAWTMGNRGEAIADARQIESDGSAHQAHLIRGTLAKLRGDFSEEAKEYVAARNATADNGRKDYADFLLGLTLEKLGLFDAAYDSFQRVGESDYPRPAVNPYVQIRLGKLPTLAELRQRDRDAYYAWRDAGYVSRAVKQFINAGRASEIASLYDSGGVMRVSREGSVGLTFRYFEDAPVVAAALRAAGRERDASRILEQLDQQIAAAIKRSGGQVPSGFLASAAQTFAMRGRREQAMSALERALANGWMDRVDLDDSSLADFGDEPAFRSLRGDPRFERIRARINGNIERERRETLAILNA